MDRLLTGPGWRREERRYPPPPSSPHITRTPVLSMASAPKPGPSSRQFPPEMPLTMTNEKESLRGLNERFAGFIDKVRLLESQNRALEKQIEDIRLKAKSSASLAKQYEPELQDLRRQVREMAVQKHQMELEQKRVEDEFTALREKCEAEARSRTEAEDSISALKKYTDRANLAQQEMDRKAKDLTDEIEFLKRTHEAEVTDILTQLKETRVPAEVSSFGKGELTAALRDIRTQLEARALCRDTHSEQRFSTQLAELTKAAESDRDALMATKAEISQYRRQLQTKNVELDSVRGMRGAMERQLYDLEQRHTAEIHHYQDTIRELEQELKNTKDGTSSHMQEYHDLLNVKMALDAEIYSYRKLLEGEESRYFTLSDTQIPVPYVYRQSPIYTLPSIPRMAGVTRKAEPQYKFVEEIITETTSEDIEISDTGSEDAEELMDGDKVCIEKEYASAGVGSEADLEETKFQESGAEDNTGSSGAEQLDNKEKPTEQEEQPLKESTDISVDLKERDMDTELAQDSLTASEETGEKDTNIYKQDNKTDSKMKETELDTKTEKTKADIKGDVEEKVALDIENVKQDIAKEIDQATNEEPKPTVQTARQEAITESAKTLTEETSPEFEDLKVKPETHHVVKPDDSSNIKTQDKDRETSEMESIVVDTSPADQQPVCQKVEAGQETHPDSEADSKQSAETSQADVLDITKAASAQDKEAKVQKELAEKVKSEAPVQGEVKEIESKKDKKEDITETVKPEKGPEETPKTQEDVTKDHLKETKVEPFERKDTSPADQQPVCQKVEAGQETHPDSKADLKQSIETSQADVLDITKAAGVQDKPDEVQKELAEKVKSEAPVQGEIKEIESKEDKKEDITKIVKPEKAVEETPKTQEDVTKDHPKDTKVEPSERKDTSPADQQLVHQKGEAGQETLPTSEADSKQNDEMSQADVLDITKAASIQDKPDEVQKELAEELKTEAPDQGEVKEIESKEKKKEDITETVKPEMRPEETPKTREDVSKDLPKDTKVEPSEREDTSSADQQLVCQKVEAGQETHPDSEADSKQSAETSQADVLDITKAASAQDKEEEVQKELAEKVKTEAPVQGEIKEIESKEDKKEDITEIVKPEKAVEETPKTQEDVTKDHPKDTKVEPSEREDTSPADQQLVHQKELVCSKSEADSKQDVETLQADVLDITKVASAQDKEAEVQKELAEKVKTEASVQRDVKEIESKKDKKEDITETVKLEKGPKETPKTREDVSKDHLKETKVEPSEREDTSPADQQPVHQKAEAGQETLPDSEADSKQSVETSQADVLDITKAVSVQDKADEVQKELEEKVKTEAPVQGEIKEIKSKEKKKEDITETVKPGKGGCAESTEAPKTQEDISKAPPKETKVEPSEVIQTKDIMDSAKKEEGTESKKTDKEADQMLIKEQTKVATMETKSEEKSHEKADGTKEGMVASLKTEENIKTKSSETHKEEIQEDKESKPHAKEIKCEQEKQETQEKLSEDITERDIIKPEGQTPKELDRTTSKDVQPEQSVLKTSPEKEPRKDQKDTDKDSHAIKDTKIEKSYETDTKPDMTKSKDLENDFAPLKDSKKSEPTEKVIAEKGQDISTKADLKKEQDVPAVTENGVNK